MNVCSSPVNTAEFVQKPRTVLQKHLASFTALAANILAILVPFAKNAALAKDETLGQGADRAKSRKSTTSQQLQLRALTKNVQKTMASYRITVGIRSEKIVNCAHLAKNHQLVQAYVRTSTNVIPIRAKMEQYVAKPPTGLPLMLVCIIVYAKLGTKEQTVKKTLMNVIQIPA